MNVEVVSFYTLIAAAALMAIALLWLLVKAFQTGVWWGLGVLLFPPVALVFIPVHWKPSRGPAALAVFSWVVAAAALVAGQFYVTRDPRVRMVEGEKHITLTRAVVEDYSFLQKHPDVAVLQMANDDVTDETLKHLEGLDRLHTLDLANTQITDEGLAVIAKLPALHSLRLDNTRISDEAFRKYLMDRPELLRLDLTGVKSIKSKTKREWKAARKDKDPKLVD